MEGYSIRQAFPSDEGSIYTLDHMARDDYDHRSVIDRAIREARSWVIERHDVVLGYGIISHEFFGRSFLELVYSDEKYRNQGLGPKLIGALERQSKSKSLFISTNQSNVHMQRVLESLGYEPSGIIHNLDPGDPELVYVKRGLRA